MKYLTLVYENCEELKIPIEFISCIRSFGKIQFNDYLYKHTESFDYGILIGIKKSILETSIKSNFAYMFTNDDYSQMFDLKDFLMNRLDITQLHSDHEDFPMPVIYYIDTHPHRLGSDNKWQSVIETDDKIYIQFVDPDDSLTKSLIEDSINYDIYDD